MFPRIFFSEPVIPVGEESYSQLYKQQIARDSWSEDESRQLLIVYRSALLADEVDDLTTEAPERIMDRVHRVDGTYDSVTIEGPYNRCEQYNAIALSEFEKDIRKVLTHLTPREELVIRLRFGIGQRSDYSLEEVGQQFGLTRERIRQIEAKALRKLREKHVSSQLLAWVEHDEHRSAKRPRACVMQAGVYVTEVGYSRRPPSPKPAEVSIETKIRNSLVFTDDDELLLGQLFGWFGHTIRSLEEVAAERYLMVSELREKLDRLTRRLRQVGIWVDAPRFISKPKPEENEESKAYEPVSWGSNQDPHRVMEAVADYYGLDLFLFDADTPDKKWARGMSMYMLYHLTSLTMKEVAHTAGLRSASAFSYWNDQIGYLLNGNEEARDQVCEIRCLIAQKLAEGQ